MANRRYAGYAWGVLAFNILVVLWGGFVRATGSGAGCGSHWPLCGGEIIPRAPQVETIIEFSHRLSSGTALLLVVALVPWAWRAFPGGHRVRWAAIAALALMIVEALVGAGLVLLELVADNVSVARAYWMAAHLANTFLLLAALTLTPWFAGGGPPLKVRGHGGVLWSLAAALVGTLVLGMSGAVTALGDTLVFTAGISPDESPFVALLVDLRIYHPVIAFLVGGLIALAAFAARRASASPTVRRMTLALGALFVVQLMVGAVNVALKAPVALQIVHLLVSDLIWIVLVLLAAATLAPQAYGLAASTSAARSLVGETPG